MKWSKCNPAKSMANWNGSFLKTNEKYQIE